MPAGAASPSADEALIAALAAHVTDRDRAICEALYEHRVLTATQLAQLHFTSLERARKRLTRLHQLRVLERFRPHRDQGSHPYHYLLDRLGTQLVAAERGLDLADLDWTRAKNLRLATSTQLRHLIDASGFFTRLALALRRAPDGALLEWSGQRCCAQRWGDLVRPDGHARLALPPGQLEPWLEWDRATEPHARLRDKLDRYEELVLALDQPLPLLFVAPGEHRERHILDGLRPTDGVRVLTTTAERHHADPLARNWLAAGAERRVALGELATTSSAAPGPRRDAKASRCPGPPPAPNALSSRSQTPTNPRRSARPNRGAAAPPLAAVWRVEHGDSLELLPTLDGASVDAVVTDPPYGIGFHNERWDGQAIQEAAAGIGHARLSRSEAYQAWCRAWGHECLRVLKPGGHLLAFGSPCTAHRVAAGLELRDTLLWLYGTGMPKSRRRPGGQATTLKPAYEPILLARRPPEASIARTVERHRTGALNIDACRVEGRYPANVICSHTPACRPDGCQADCAAALVDTAAAQGRAPSNATSPTSRLFYCPKVGRRERDAGCEHLPRRSLDLFPNAQAAGGTSPARNPHPTVKPIALMRWLVRLATPRDGLVLDPFCGSGTTGAAAALEHRRFLGVELDPGHAAIARARIAHWSGQGEQESGHVPFARSA